MTDGDARNGATERPLTGAIRPGGPALTLAEYEQAGGYAALRRALSGMSPAEITAAVTASRLRGRGGAGFPTGQKWGFVPAPDPARQPAYVLVNADEMEPGTFKDRLLLEGNPHQLIEGVALMAYAISASVAYVFIRGEYFPSLAAVRNAIGEALQAGYLGRHILGSRFDLEVHVHRSAGRYMCGEETGLINALQGHRAYPRAKPPFPPAVGLWGRPGVVQNVETLCNIPHIVLHGPDWFKSLSRTDDGGTKIYGISGRVQRPGLWELPLGTTMRELLDLAGGMRPGYQFRAAQPGGASTSFITSEHLDIPIDFESLKSAGSRIGTGTAIVLDDRTCPIGALRNMFKFFAQESCGWCTPCREGLPWAARILSALEEREGGPDDLELLAHHARFLATGFTFCALAPGAIEPLASGLRHFAEDFKRHAAGEACPYDSARVGSG